MQITVQSDGFTVDQKLVDFVETKLNKLETFYDNIIDATVFLIVESAKDRENKLVEVKVNVPGNEFMVKKQSKSFEESVDLCSDTLRRVLIKHKEKVMS